MGPRLTNNKVYVAGAAVIAVLLVITGVLLWKHYDGRTATGVNHPGAQTTSERVIAEVGKLYKLPTGESPTVARVQNTTKLPVQDFYADAQDGDYVLVYPKNKLALLYRESQNILIRVGPITVNE